MSLCWTEHVTYKYFGYNPQSLVYPPGKAAHLQLIAFNPNIIIQETHGYSEMLKNSFLTILCDSFIFDHNIIQPKHYLTLCFQRLTNLPILSSKENFSEGK